MSPVNALDLSPLDSALADLMRLTSGHSAAELMEEAGRIVQSQWRDNIQAAWGGTGNYIKSIAVDVIHDDERGAWVSVGTDAADPRTKKPYPIFLEYGWRKRLAGGGRRKHTKQSGPADYPGVKTGHKAFATTRAKVVRGVSAKLERKLSSRKKRY